VGGQALPAGGFDNMAKWLFKEEPEHYSYADLERDGATLWDRVTNALARQNLRKVRKGDRILLYHTGKEKAVVAEMRAASDATTDTNDADPKAVVVKVKPVRKLPVTVPLSRIKADPALADWDLVRNSRLSVMPVTEQQWRRIEEMSRASEPEA
jgi:predicted RNA-binding protein with PUA-like domain